jgi:RHS repeat-associated protein
LQYEKAFAYDPVGNRLTQTTIGAGPAGTPLAPGSLSYAYDPRDRLETETGTLAGQPIGTIYGYDDNGNLVTKSADGALYAWDLENRLIRAETGPAGNRIITEHAYDADGNRVRTAVTPATSPPNGPPAGPPTETHFLIDTSGSLSHVVAELEGADDGSGEGPSGEAGDLKAFYVRGDDLLAVMRPLVATPASPADWQTRCYHSDHIGSIRRLTNEAGQVTDGYTYTAFGELIAHTGTDPQPYAFTGEPYDPNVGFQYHRARWMDPEAGRFVSLDPFRGLAEIPNSLQPHSYVASNPVDATDPSGAFSSLIWGREVHRRIGLDFEGTKPEIRISDRSLNEILFRRTTQPHLVDYVGLLRPDLVDLETKEVFEIKPAARLAEGFFQLEGYILALNWADPDKSLPWREGLANSYMPPSSIPVRFGFDARVLPPVAGVIPYDVVNAEFTLAGAMIGIAVAAFAAFNTADLTSRVGLATLTNALAPGVP